MTPIPSIGTVPDMPRAVALLRGINTGGHRVAMADLRRHAEAFGLKNVGTFIASGNLLFDAPAGPHARLEERLEAHLEKALGFGAPAFIRTLPELEAILSDKARPATTDGDSLYVSFVRRPLDAAARRAILACESPFDAFTFREREYFWLCRGKISEVSQAWPKLEKLARKPDALPSTSRTISALEKMVAAMRA